MAASFRAELIKTTKEPIDLYEVSLDTARVQTQQDETPFVDYIHALIKPAAIKQSLKRLPHL